MPSDAELERDVREALRVANMDEMSLKVIRKGLEAKWQVDLSSKKAFLKATVTTIMTEDQQEEQQEEQEAEKVEEVVVKVEEVVKEEKVEVEEEEEDEDDDDEDYEEVAKQKKPKRADFQVSPALYEFLGSKEEFMAHGDVTKAVWAYIRAESLQDPKDRRKIRNDDKMFKLFKCKNMNMMQIAKKLSPHLKKYSDLVGADVGGSSKKRASGGASATPRAKKAKVDSAQSPSPAPKGRPKKTATATKAGAKPKGRGKAIKGGDEAPVKRTRAPSTVMWKVSDELAAVVGSHEATIDEIRSGVHLYIKKHNLQDPSNRTIVICDDTLEGVMGQKVVKMFGMQSLISPHRLYKL